MHRQGRAVRVREGVPAAVSVSIASGLRGQDKRCGWPKVQKPATRTRAAKINPLSRHCLPAWPDATPAFFHTTFHTFSLGDSPLKCISLPYGVDDPLILEVSARASAEELGGPLGVAGAEAEKCVAQALSAPVEGPPLVSHIVPGDRVVVALCGDLPQLVPVVAAVGQELTRGGVDAADLTILQAPALDIATGSEAGGVPEGWRGFDATVDADTSYLAADSRGEPLYLARALVDADVVIAIGVWAWDAALGGRSPEGELWPTFSRLTSRQAFTRQLTRRGRRALPEWRSEMEEIRWQVGLCASLRLVAGRNGSLAEAVFGLPEVAAAQARTHSAPWRPTVAQAAGLAIASLADPRGSLAGLTRAVAAAARVTSAQATICVAAKHLQTPGLIFSRWRQGAPLEPLVREAVNTGDVELMADALQTRLFARALGERRLVLLSELGEDTVEDLEFGFAATPEVVERLAHRASSLVVLHEADRLLPTLA